MRTRTRWAMWSQRTMVDPFSALEVQMALARVERRVVDLQRAINETEDGRKAKDRLKKLFESRQQGLDKKQQELKKLKDELEQQKNVLARDVLETKVEAYQKQLVDLQQVYVENQKELAEKEGELTKDIVARMERILRRIGQSEGYTLIMERGEGGVCDR